MFQTEEQWWEEQNDRTSGPYTVADEHRDWHTVHGPYGCPWDACLPPDWDDYPPAVDLVKRAPPHTSPPVAEEEPPF